MKVEEAEEAEEAEEFVDAEMEYANADMDGEEHEHLNGYEDDTNATVYFTQKAENDD